MTTVSVVVPIKAWTHGKTRIAAPVATRFELARAMSLDTLSAVFGGSEVGEVIVVTADEEVARAVGHLGARVVPDPQNAYDPLNEAIRQGLAVVPTARPAVVLMADLPCLTSQALDLALEVAVAGGPLCVPDRDGSGTTLLGARRASWLTPKFGAGSAAAHEEAGVMTFHSAPAAVRRDVDTFEDLLAALNLGVGNRTQSVVAAMLAHPSRTSAGRRKDRPSPAAR